MASSPGDKLNSGKSMYSIYTTLYVEKICYEFIACITLSGRMWIFFFGNNLFSNEYFMLLHNFSKYHPTTAEAALHMLINPTWPTGMLYILKGINNMYTPLSQH